MLPYSRSSSGSKSLALNKWTWKTVGLGSTTPSKVSCPASAVTLFVKLTICPIASDLLPLITLPGNASVLFGSVWST